VRIVATEADSDLLDVLQAAAGDLDAEVVIVPGTAEKDGKLIRALRNHPQVVFIDASKIDDFETLRAETHARGIALVAACHTPEEQTAVVNGNVDEWLDAGASVEEMKARIECALKRVHRAESPEVSAQVVEHLQYEELLYDRFTGFPTLPVMLERGREILEHTGSLTILYIEFVRYSKLEEIYGWQRLDEVLQTTARAVREFYNDQEGARENVLMVSHTGDDDFIFFTEVDDSDPHVEERINTLARGMENSIRERLEKEHGEDVAGLFGIYIGATTLYRNPKVRTERMIYRGIREAQHVARSVEQRERTRKVSELKELLRDEDVFIEYHPIVVTETKEVYGYEALARGGPRGLRSPEVMFGVAEEANLIWELSRLCRKRAIEGIDENLDPNQLLFLNIDPHDFRDPTFRYMDVEEIGVDNPERIVLEITERTAITDYPVFQKYLKEFRAHGFRFAVDDAGSGYAGLGSIANLEPDFIKLDISLISNIDTNFMKQNLVETMMSFANDQGIQVIAEGVEREEEYQAVKELGVHLTQGFLFHKPKYVGKITTEA